MQRQKTIAKWLAVLLLLTLAVACYIVLNAILGKRDGGQNIAGAQDESDAGDVLPEQGDDSPTGGEGEDIPPHIPVYSQFPREATIAGGLSVLNIGGEGDDALLDYIYLDGKHLLIFETNSLEHDVKQAGIHIAIVEQNALTGTALVAENETYVDCTTLAGSLLVVTKSSAQTTLRLIDPERGTTLKRTLPLYDNYSLFSNDGATRLYAADEEGVHIYSLSKTLSASKSSRIARLGGASIACIIPSGSSDLLFLQTEDGISTYTYSANEGFISRNELLNCRFEQILPIKTTDGQSLALLASNDDGYALFGIKTDGEQFAKRQIDGAKTAAIFKDGENIMLLTESDMYTFCSHFDYISKTAADYVDDLGSFELGLTPYGELYATTEDGMTMLKASGAQISAALSLSGAEAPIFVPTSGGMATAYSTANSDFENVCFGGSDVYLVFNAQSE